MAKKQQSFHWTDIAAENIIREKGDKKVYIVESGITPSGVIHLGNFREAITEDFIKLALEKKGKKVDFLYVWDNYDALRKVPKNLPEQKIIQDNMGKPVSLVPDPFGCHDNYAKHFENQFEKEIECVGVKATYVNQYKEYTSGKFIEEIKTALDKTEAIKEILNKYRKEPLAQSWLPIIVFCEKCQRDTTKNLGWDGKYSVTYSCKCKHQGTVDFRKKHLVTLRWRVDWPMRWHKNKVDFEAAGKDHYAAGGSVDTSRQIQEKVYGTEPPMGFMYEWIGIKGKGQFASSAGNVVTLTEMLEIYEPEIVRWLFAGTRPNKEFAISFDADVLKIYEDYDKCERIYFDEHEVSEKEREKHKVAYELSAISKIPKTIPYQPGFRHLTTLLQIHSLDVGKVVEMFNDLKEKKRVEVRAACAKNWLHKYAPEEFKFTVQEKCQVTVSKEGKELLHQIAEKLLEKEWDDKALHEEMYMLCKNKEFPPGDFFKLAYNVLVNKDKGPRLASFILAIGREKVARLFKSV